MYPPILSTLYEQDLGLQLPLLPCSSPNSARHKRALLSSSVCDGVVVVTSPEEMSVLEEVAPVSKAAPCWHVFNKELSREQTRGPIWGSC